MSVATKLGRVGIFNEELLSMNSYNRLNRFITYVMSLLQQGLWLPN